MTGQGEFTGTRCEEGEEPGLEKSGAPAGYSATFFMCAVRCRQGGRSIFGRMMTADVMVGEARLHCK